MLCGKVYTGIDIDSKEGVMETKEQIRSEEEIRSDYLDAVRNYNQELRKRIEDNPLDQPGDSVQVRGAKKLYRELTPYIASGCHWDENGLQIRA
mgnify:FL=1